MELSTVQLEIDAITDNLPQLAPLTGQNSNNLYLYKLLKTLYKRKLSMPNSVIYQTRKFDFKSCQTL